MSGLTSAPSDLFMFFNLYPVRREAIEDIIFKMTGRSSDTNLGIDTVSARFTVGVGLALENMRAERFYQIYVLDAANDGSAGELSSDLLKEQSMGSSSKMEKRVALLINADKSAEQREEIQKVASEFGLVFLAYDEKRPTKAKDALLTEAGIAPKVSNDRCTVM